MVGISKEHSIITDLTSHQLVVRTLTEAKITCGEEEKVCACALSCSVPFIAFCCLLMLLLCVCMYNSAE